MLRSPGVLIEIKVAHSCQQRRRMHGGCLIHSSAGRGCRRKSSRFERPSCRIRASNPNRVSGQQGAAPRGLSPRSSDRRTAARRQLSPTMWLSTSTSRGIVASVMVRNPTESVSVRSGANGSRDGHFCPSYCCYLPSWYGRKS